MKNLDLTKEIFKKYNIKYHELTEGDYTYIMPFKDSDIENYIFVQNYGLVPLEKSEQFNEFMEFYKGNIASY